MRSEVAFFEPKKQRRMVTTICHGDFSGSTLRVFTCCFLLIDVDTGIVDATLEEIAEKARYKTTATVMRALRRLEGYGALKLDTAGSELVVRMEPGLGWTGEPIRMSGSVH